MYKKSDRLDVSGALMIASLLAGCGSARANVAPMNLEEAEPCAQGGYDPVRKIYTSCVSSPSITVAEDFAHMNAQVELVKQVCGAAIEMKESEASGRAVSNTRTKVSGTFMIWPVQGGKCRSGRTTCVAMQMMHAKCD